MKRLYVDAETSPNVVLSWRVGRDIDIDHDNIQVERRIICIAYKWQGAPMVQALTWDKNQDDKSMLREFIEVANEADEIVGHNIDRFDMPWIKTRALFHGLQPFPSWKTADTLQWARRLLLFNSNRLDYIGRFLGVGGKIKTEFKLWKEVMINRDPSALKTLVDYCKRDVELLEKVHQKLLSIGPVKTHAGVLGGGEKWQCPHDGSRRVEKSKTRVTASGTIQHQMQCLDCGRYYSISDSAHRAYQEWRKNEEEKKRLAIQKGCRKK